MTNTSINQSSHDPFNFDLSELQLPARVFEGPDPDRAVTALNSALTGQRILLLVSGGIAAYKTPGLVRMLRSYGAEVDIRTTENAEHFIGTKSLEWAAAGGKVLCGNQLSGEIEHLAPYSIYLACPATYNFINGVATGRGDTATFTTMAAALGRVAKGEAKLLVLPCMNSDMNNPILYQNMCRLKDLGVSFINPRQDRGKLEYPGSEIVTVAVARQVSQSPLKNSEILVTGGPTPVPLDDVRQITNIFKGRLGIEIAKELTIRGANPTFLLGGSVGIPGYLEPFTKRYSTYDRYRELVLGYLETKPSARCAVLSSAVADYRPSEIHVGKIASKQSSITLPPLVPTEKVVDRLHEQAQQLPIVSFKLLSRISVDDLILEAQARLKKHSELVVANRLEDCSAGCQTVYLVTKAQVSKVEGSKRQVAAAIVDAMEQLPAILK